MSYTALAQKRLNAKCTGHEYYVHECFNRNERCCDATYKVTHQDYVDWESMWPYDCFNETSRKRFVGGCYATYTAEHHLYLDAGDCDDPNEVTEVVYDWTV